VFDDNTYHVWQLTDPHIDEFYVEGTVANCGELICCRANNHVKSGDNTQLLGGKFGVAVARCDIPFITYQSALDFVASFFPADYKRDNELFVFYGGDSTAHDDWDYTKDRIVNQMAANHKALLQTMRDPSSSYQSLVLSTIGNHDGYPIDQFDLSPGSDWYLGPWADIMSQSGINNTEALNSLRTFGYYSVLVRPGVRAIVLNTQYQDILNFYLYKTSDKDPGQQLAFMKLTLQLAQKNNEKVIILGHIPFGITDTSAKPECSFAFTSVFAELMEQYSETVIFSAWGHTHKDSFRLIMDKATGAQAKHVGFVAPSVSTWTKQNPSVRLFLIDKQTFQLVDMITYTANITQGNIDGHLTFQEEYSAKESYHMPDLSPASWYRVANQLITNDTTWSTFSGFYHNKLYPACEPNVFKQCRLAHYCNTVTVDAEHYANCILN
jgi:sphingomyelin phosphodiesterase